MAVEKVQSEGVLAELLKEERHFRPPESFAKQALVKGVPPAEVAKPAPAPKPFPMRGARSFRRPSSIHSRITAW